MMMHVELEEEWELDQVVSLCEWYDKIITKQQLPLPQNANSNPTYTSIPHPPTCHLLAFPEAPPHSPTN